MTSRSESSYTHDMKLAKVTTFYGEYLDFFYRTRPSLAKDSYVAQKAALDEDAFGWADYWSNALRPFGYETLEIVGNAKSLQEAWLRENGQASGLGMKELVLEQLRRFQPEILFMVDYSSFPVDWLKRTRELCPSIRLIVGWCGAPYSDRTVFDGYDLVLSCIPELVEHFRSLGHDSAHLNHAFDPRIRARIGEPAHSRLQFSFIGQIVKTNGFHGEREKLLIELARRIPIEIFSSAGKAGKLEDLKSYVKMGLFDLGRSLTALGIPGKTLEKIPAVGKHLATITRPNRASIGELRMNFRPPVFGLEMFRTLRDSTVTLNQHINASKASASNMRLFEATGVGACLLTDWKPNLTDLFEPDSEVVTYRSAEECAEKARWLLANPAAARSIGTAAQRRAAKDHTFSVRAQILDDLIKARLK